MCSNCFKDSSAYIVLAGEDFNLLKEVDQHFCDYAIMLGGEEVQIPAMISKEHLRRCGYFSTFPQHLTIAAHIKPNNYKKISEQKDITLNDIALEDICFTPAACLHIYPIFENQTVDQRIITTKARVYRYEDKQYDGLVRLWDFTVREIVFIGSPSYVKKQLIEIEKNAVQFLRSLGVCGEIVNSSDHFYPTTKNAIKEKIQLANALKHELQVKINNEHVAIASFNYHDTHFTAEYNFDKNGQIVTGCAGFGLERWVAAHKKNL